MRALAVDIETTGLDLIKHEMIEFAAVGVDFESGESLGYAFSVPFDESKADPRALEINGWGERTFAPMRTHQEGLELMRESLGRNTLIVASPSFFDMGFLWKFWNQHSDERPPWGHRRVIDLKSLAVGMGYDFGIKNSEIGDKLGIPDTSDHSAYADAEWTWRMFWELTYSKRGHHEL